MWIANSILAVIGFSAGIIVAGGLFSFIIGLGVISDFADRTHTGEHILLYEDCVALGGMLGNLWWLYQFPIRGGEIMLMISGTLSGIFVGAWSMALAEMLDIFPIFVRRFKGIRYVPHMILGIALGKGLGALFSLL